MPIPLDGWTDLSGATTGTGSGVDLGNQSTFVKVLIEWSSGVTSGTVVVEEAISTSAGGTWAPVATVAFNGTAPLTNSVSYQGALHAIRTRISATVTGGFVLTRIFAR